MVPENILRMAVEVDPVKVKNKLCFFNDVKKYFKERVSSIEKEVSNHFCAYNPIGYIPQAVGIRFGRILDLSPLHIFYLGRLFNLLAAVFLIFNAIKFAPFGKEIFLFTGLLPMTIHQLASLSCDALTISGLMFFTSQVLSLSQRTYIKYTSLVYLILSSLIFIQIKQGYIGFLLLLFILSYHQFASKKGYLFLLSFALLSHIALLIAFGQIVNIEDSMRVMPGYSGYYREQIDFIINNPINYGAIFLRTLIGKFIGIAASGIGVLGWLDIRFPIVFYLFMLLTLIILLLINDEGILLKYYQRFILFATYLVTLLIIFTIEFIVWTKPLSSYIRGIQGRYFIPTIPLLILSFYKSQWWIIDKYNKLKMNKTNRNIIIFLIYIFVAFISIKTIYSHFTDFFNN